MRLARPRLPARWETFVADAERLLDEIVTERLDATGRTDEAEIDTQRRLHVRAARFAGRFSGTHPRRSETAKARVRARLSERRARSCIC